MLLKTHGLTKQFGNMYALKDIAMEIAPGEIHGLVGENGAGKSTLIKILTGVYGSNSGEISWHGEKVEIDSPKASRDLGINVIHQDRHLIPSFTGVENIYLGLAYETKKGVVIDWERMKEKATNLMEELGISVPLHLPASSLTPPQKTLVEIIRAMMTHCQLLILDEPTASLTDTEAALLFKTILKLKEKGTSVLYVSHRIDEILKLTDKITVFKNGQLVATVKTQEISKAEIIAMMTDNWQSEIINLKKNIGQVMLSVKNIASKDKKVINGAFEVRSGEILGIFGLTGSGRTELLECIYGYRPTAGGTVTLNGKELVDRTPAGSLQAGMVLICEDRRGMALIGNLSVKENTLLSTIDRYAKYGIVSKGKEIADTRKKIQSLSIKTNGYDQPVNQLSGGNQQKVVFAKALMSNPQVILCDEPTQAVDVKTRAEIHNLLHRKAQDGNAVVFVSSDLKEVLELADSIQVMAAGCTKEYFKNEQLTSEQVLKYCYAH